MIVVVECSCGEKGELHSSEELKRWMEDHPEHVFSMDRIDTPLVQ